MQAIETRYKGYRFRSRLEARWAVYFDALGIKWVYEPEGYVLADGKRYLPDFWLPGLKCFAEVKPSTLTLAEFIKCQSLPGECVILDGLPENRIYAFAPKDEAQKMGVDELAAAYLAYLGREYCGVNFIESSERGRMWIDSAGNFVSSENHPAVNSARSARFEHGENGGAR